jgi:hypothetical protein
MLAEDALKSIPIFKGGHSEYGGWRMTARKFIKIGFYSQETAFQLLKKTSEGDTKKVVELISVEDEYACEDLMQLLEDEYGDVSFLAAEQKRKLTEMTTISYGARNLLDFCRTVNKIVRILWEAGEDVDTREFVSLVVSRLPVAYRSRLTDALRLKKYKGLEATLEELRQIALTERANGKMIETYASKEQEKKKDEKNNEDKKKDEKKNGWQKKDKGSTVNSYTTTTQPPTGEQPSNEKNCYECSGQHDLADCTKFQSLPRNE